MRFFEAIRQYEPLADINYELEDYLNKDVSPNLYDESGNSALYTAFKEKNLFAFDLLISYGADANLPFSINSEEKISSLHEAIRKNRRANEIIIAGADVNLRSIKNNMTPLHLTVENWDYSKSLIYLLAEGADINAQDENGKTALHIAVLKNSRNLFSILIDYGADYKIRDNKGKTALDYIYHHSRQELLNIFSLKSGIYNRYEFNKLFSRRLLGSEKDKMKDIFQSSIVPYSTKEGRAIERKSIIDIQKLILSRAIENSDAFTINAILAKGFDVNSVIDEDGSTPLHKAIKNKSKVAIDIFLKAKADIYKLNAEKESPLLFAAKKRHIEALEYLLPQRPTRVIDLLLDYLIGESRGEFSYHKLKHKIGFDGKTIYDFSSADNIEEVAYLIRELGVSVDTRDKLNRTPLIAAATKNNADLVEFFIKMGADINAQDEFGNTALHKASDLVHFNVVRKILAAEPNLSIQNKNGNTALSLSVKDYCISERKKYILVKALLDAGAEVDSRGEEGKTALNLAVKNFSLLRLLHDHGANLNLFDDHLKTPLHYACEEGLIQVVNFLLENGAVIDARSKDGDMPIHLAISSGNLALVNIIIGKYRERFSPARIPLESFVNYQGKTVLHLATEKRFFKMTEIILKEGAIEALNLKDSDGNTPLHLAAMKYDLRLVKLFLSLGADVNSLNSVKETPLLSCIKKTSNKSFLIYKELIKYGASARAIDEKGFSALHYISIFGTRNTLFVKTLLRDGADLFQEDQTGYSCLLLASYWSNENIVEIYLSFLREFRSTIPDLEDKVMNVLRYEIGNGKIQSMLEEFLSYIKDPCLPSLPMVSASLHSADGSSFLEKTELCTRY